MSNFKQASSEQRGRHLNKQKQLETSLEVLFKLYVKWSILIQIANTI